MWAALSFLAVVTIGALSVLVIKTFVEVISYLQPILIPIAIAGVLAFLLEPVINRLSGYGISRLRAVILVFLVVFSLTTALLVWLLPTVYDQGVKLAQRLPEYTLIARERMVSFAEKYGEKIPNPFGAADSTASEDSAAAENGLEPYVAQVTEYVETHTPELLKKAGNFLQRSIGGFLGFFGFLLGLIIVPIYLFFFLLEGPKISQNWSRYLPLRASRFKDEVVATLTEINGYLINFFRGQLLVSLVDGAFTAIGLLIIGLDYALLIGLMVGIIGLIPYIGILLCWVPAILIAVVQWPGEWWPPIMVTVIFIVVQQLDGLLIAPRIVGNSVGLHPMTVIVSLFAWTLLLGGLLGAILAVPLTATLKVLLKRYVWEQRRFTKPQPPDLPDETLDSPAEAASS